MGEAAENFEKIWISLSYLLSIRGVKLQNKSVVWPAIFIIELLSNWTIIIEFKKTIIIEFNYYRI